MLKSSFLLLKLIIFIVITACTSNYVNNSKKLDTKYYDSFVASINSKKENVLIQIDKRNSLFCINKYPRYKLNDIKYGYSYWQCRANKIAEEINFSFISTNEKYKNQLIPLQEQFQLYADFFKNKNN